MIRYTCTLLALFFATVLSAQQIHPDYVDGVVYFQLKNTYPMQLLSWDGNDRLQEMPFFTEVFNKYGVNDILRPFHLFGDEGLLRILELHLDRPQAVDSLIAELQASEWVNYAEKVPLMRTMYRPNDPYYGTVKNLNWKWHLDMIKADSAWDVQRGTANIKVAIVDNFVWEDHPDLPIDSANACTVAYDRKKGGYYYTVGTATPPATIAQGSSENAYYASHGTHCAGLVGAINNNGKGVASIGGGVTLMGIAATTTQYPRNVLYGFQGLQWAVENGARVVSMSFGGSTASQTYTAVAEACYKNGIVLVAAAGNEGNATNNIIYPAGLSTVISVASVDGDAKLSYFSQWGSGRADIAAPGGFIKSTDGKVSYPNILSTTYCLSYAMKNYGFEKTYYDGMQGTSMATPIVSGLVGLMLSKDSTLQPGEIKARLQRTAMPLDPSSEHTIDGYGYINAYRALLDEYLIIAKDSLFFSKNVGSKDSLLVSSSKPWTLSALPSWLSASTLKGDSGKTMVVFTILSENNGTTERSYKLTIKGEGNTGSKPLTAVQKHFSFILNIDKKQVCFAGAKGLYDTLHVHATIPWSLNNDASWLAADVRQVSADSSIVVLATRSSNSWGRNRDINLIFSSAYMPSDTVYVLQRIPDFITLSASQVNIGAVKGDTASVNVYSNVQWTLSGGDSTWIVPDLTSASDSSRIVFTVQSDNATGDFRTANYTVSDGSITKTFTVRQAHNLTVVEAVSDSWTVYPNPTAGHLVCRFPEGVADLLRLTDAQGRLLKTFRVEGCELEVDLSELPAGLYFLQCGNVRKQVVKK